jgi:hypothetical protein
MLMTLLLTLDGVHNVGPSSDLIVAGEARWPYWTAISTA